VAPVFQSLIHSLFIMACCKGQGWFFKTRKKTGTLEAVLVSNKRIYPAHKPSGSLFYIECRNLHSMPREGAGAVIAVKEQDKEWCLGMLLAVTDELLHFFEWTGVPFWKIRLDAGWDEYKECFCFKQILLVDVQEFRFLNQTYGQRPGGMSLVDGLTNNQDGKLQCSAKGPDLFLPASVKIPGDYSQVASCSRKSRQSPVATQLHLLIKKKGLGASRKRNRSRRDCPVFAKLPKKSLGHLVVHCILVEDQGPAQRTDVGQQHYSDTLIAVPYCCREPVGWFAEVPWKILEHHILPTSGQNTPFFHDLLLKKHQSSEIFATHVDVSKYPKGLRIRVVPPEFFDRNDVDSFQTSSIAPRIVMAKEAGEPHDPRISVGPLMTDKFVASCHTGLPVSHWIRCKEANPFDITIEDMSLLKKAYGPGYGSRLTTKVVGFNLYQGTRQKGNRAAPSPIEGPGQSAFSQFYRMVYRPMYQFKTEKTTNPLGRAAIYVASILDPVLHSVFPAAHHNTALRFCSQKIITFGKSGVTLGFFNTCHTDKGDVVKVADLGVIQKLIDPYLHSTDPNIKKSVDYIQRWLNWGPIGISTTCVYQFVGHNPSDEVLCFFLLDGLGLAVQLNTHVCHMFFGHLFSHRTAMPIIIRAGKVFYKDPNFQVFAWGGNTYERSS
jgi:hypothetical protein